VSYSDEDTQQIGLDYYDFLEADILCLLHDYGPQTARRIRKFLGADADDVELALTGLLLSGKIREVGRWCYEAVDEVAVRRFKKELPEIF